jgi:putative oxidoreductase
MARITDEERGALREETVEEAPADSEHIPSDDEDSLAAEEEPRKRGGLVGFLLNPYLTLISRLFLAGIFILSGMTKLGIPEPFAESIRSYEVPLPDFVVQTMAVGLPPLELGLGVWLLIGLFTRFSAAVSGGLMVVFLIALIQAAFRGLDPNCGCFAGAQLSNPWGTAMIQALGPVGTYLANERIGAEIIIRDFVFLLMSIHLFFVPTVLAVDNLRNRPHATDDEMEELDEGQLALDES